MSKIVHSFYSNFGGYITIPLEWDDLTLAVKKRRVGGFQVNGQIAVTRDETLLSMLPKKLKLYTEVVPKTVY